MDVLLLHSNLRNVADTHLILFKVVGARIQIYIYSVILYSTLSPFNRNFNQIYMNLTVEWSRHYKHIY